jgi:hypothetical protein
VSRSCQKIGPTRKIGFHFLLLPGSVLQNFFPPFPADQ